MILSALLIALVLNVAIGLKTNECSLLELSSNPGIIHPILTKSLQLRCSVKKDQLQDDTKTSLVNYKLKALTKSQTKIQLSDTKNQTGQSAIKSSKSQEEAEFSKLLTLVMTKKNKETGVNETIASVIGCDSPVIEPKYVGTVQVEGNTEGSTIEGEQGFITLTWKSPMEEHAGEFQCEASALNYGKHSVTLTASLEIQAIEPKIADLVKYVSTYDKEIVDLKSKVLNLSEENQYLKNQTNALAKDDVAMKYKIDRIPTPMIQTGSLSCGSQNVRFSPAFKITPIIFTSFSTMTIRTSSYSSHIHQFSTTAHSATNTGCTFSCSIGSIDDSVSFQWMAIGF